MKRKTLCLCLNILCMVLSLVTIAVGMISPAFAHNSFDNLLIVFLACGAVISGLSLFLKRDFLPHAAAALYGCGLGRIIYRGAEVIADKVNNINFVGGNFETVVVYIALMLICCILAVTLCFCKEPEA